MVSLLVEYSVWHSICCIGIIGYKFMERLMELYNYDTHKTESVDIADLTESNGLSYIPDAWPDLKALYSQLIKGGYDVAEALLFVFVQHVSNGTNFKAV